MKKVFYLTTTSNCLPAYFPVDSDSREIFELVLVALEKSAKEYAKRERYLDLANFRRIGPYIDWRRMMDDVMARDLD